MDCNLRRFNIIFRWLPYVPHRRYFLSKSNLSIKIPDRIERQPTDILKALSKIFDRDLTSQHYKFPDDPYFEANSSGLKRIKALSIESGRKSARWIVENNKRFFQDKIAEPTISAFSPQLEYNENSDIRESTLINAIQNRNIEAAQTIYEIIIKKKIDISALTKQKLLELVCFHNCVENKSKKDLESKWHQANNDKIMLKTWSDNNFAENLFKSINNDCPLAYSAIIQGMMKFGQITRGFELFQTAQEKKLILSIHAYNEILHNVLKIKEIERWSYILEILKEIKLKKVKPNIATLNAVLHSLAKMEKLPNKMELAKKTLAEFRKLDVQPSLGTYYYLIKIQCSEKIYRKKNVNFVLQALKEIKEKALKIEHPSDMLFFPGVMGLCNVALKSSECAHLLNKILMKEDNIKFIRGKWDEDSYYDDYINVSFMTEPIECAVEMYKTLVPCYHNPSIRIHQKILSTIDDNEAYEYLPVVWKNLKTHTKVALRTVIPSILNMMPRYKGNDENVTTIFINVADLVLSDVMGQKENEFRSNNGLISNAIIAFLKFGNFNDALILIKKVFDSNEQQLLSHNALSVFFDICMYRKLDVYILDCIKHGKLIDHPNLKEMAKKALSHLTELNEIDFNWISSLANSSAEKFEQPKENL